MKAVIINKYGSANELKMAEVLTPEVKPDQVLVRNYFTTVNPMDWKVRSGQFKLFVGRKFPKIFGCECAGIVERVGENVKSFKEADRVMLNTGFKFGTYAEFVSVTESSVFYLPDEVNFEEGSTLTCAGGTAYNALHKIAKIKSGNKVLINGAYGGIGSFAVQLAKLAGAEVTAVCSTENIENVKALHADHVIDYTRQDIYAMENRFDLVFDTVGKLTLGKALGILKDRGIMVTTVGSGKIMLTSLFNFLRSKKVKTVWNAPGVDDMATLSSLVAEKKLKVIIDRSYMLDEVKEAHQYSETGKAKGKILIKINRKLK